MLYWFQLDHLSPKVHKPKSTLFGQLNTKLTIDLFEIQFFARNKNIDYLLHSFIHINGNT